MTSFSPAAIVFDLDGTLVDSAPDLRVAVNRMLESLGAEPLDLETVIGFIGKGVGVLVRKSLGHRGLPVEGAPFDAALASFHDFYSRDLLTLTRPYAGVEAMLGRFAAGGIPMGICTNKPEVPARDMCRTLGFDRFFGSIVGGDTLPVRKPDAAPRFRAIADLGATPDRTLYVGDSETDYETARNAGTPFAFFEGGYQRRDIPGFRPDFRLAAVADLQGLLGL